MKDMGVLARIYDRLLAVLPGHKKRSGPVIPVVRLSGVIGKMGRLQRGVTLEATAGPLEKAFGIKSAPAVALLIDSPGGSPVQSHLIFKRIRALAEEKEKTVLGFAEDVCASGGYMIACACDELFVDPATVIGSIGVVSAGFGFVDAIEKLGIERRVHAAGKEKVTLDPFQPERRADVSRLKDIQDEIHTHFIELVKSRRGDVLADDPAVFSGRFWSGQAAVGLGLADRIGDMRSVLREKYGEKVRPKVIAAPKPLLQRMRFGSESVGADIVEAAQAELTERLARARYGR